MLMRKQPKPIHCINTLQSCVTMQSCVFHGSREKGLRILWFGAKEVRNWGRRHPFLDGFSTVLGKKAYGFFTDFLRMYRKKAYGFFTSLRILYGFYGFFSVWGNRSTELREKASSLRIFYGFRGKGLWILYGFREKAFRILYGFSTDLGRKAYGFFTDSLRI